MNFSSLPASPAALKSVNPYLQRAKEMEKVDPVISYWCAFHAAQTCMSIGHTEPESREFLMRLLDLLEQAKTQLSENDAITNNLAATAYVENFGLKIFDGADKEDQQGLSTRTTAQRFLAAACFLEVLQSLTNQPEPDIIQKIKYSKWRAGSISKALRDGSAIQPPESVTRSPAAQLNAEGSQQDPPQSSQSQAPEGFSGWPTELGTSSMTKLPSPIPAPSQSVHNSSGKPSPFPSTVFPPIQQNNTPSSADPPTSSTMLSQHPSSQLSRFPTHPTPAPTDSAQPIQQTFYSTPASSSVQPSNPSPIETQYPIPTHPSSAAASAVQISSSLPANPIKIAQAQKHAKWAISALNFDDIPTAKNQLQIALDTLNSL
ncbi:hypothetical protein PCASD_25331 [Puccinia coronata f. sp. avenae]|uniref:Vta1/callose synthase N-terminal domain-containing protein n=1 Tax=Puccinia coronata f. sp. avenae TaxID=200324 RepID=A0A2N5TJK0_9BASI|nr:hypothetical protein PCASD_25331 [Puccinia coronata f. sp. avenae]